MYVENKGKKQDENSHIKFSKFIKLSLDLNKCKDLTQVISGLKRFQYLGALSKNEPLHTLQLKFCFGITLDVLPRKE